MSSFFVTATIRANPEVNLDHVKTEIALLTEKTLEEKDCYRFEVKQSLKDERLFIMWEEFANKEALDKHFEFEHTKQFIAQELNLNRGCTIHARFLKLRLISFFLLP